MFSSCWLTWAVSDNHTTFLLQLVAVYTRGMIPGLWPYIWSCVIMKVSTPSIALQQTSPFNLYVFIINTYPQMQQSPHNNAVRWCLSGVAGAEPDVGTSICDSVHVFHQHRLQCSLGSQLWLYGGRVCSVSLPHCPVPAPYGCVRNVQKVLIIL